jgi:hypothetical protein
MGMVSFDTHQAVLSLRRSGFSDPQAEGLVQVLSTSRDDLATKADIQLLRSEMKQLESGMKQIETGMLQMESRLEMRLTIKMGVMFFSGLTISTAVLDFLLKSN